MAGVLGGSSLLRNPKNRSGGARRLYNPTRPHNYKQAIQRHKFYSCLTVHPGLLTCTAGEQWESPATLELWRPGHPAVGLDCHASIPSAREAMGQAPDRIVTSLVTSRCRLMLS